MVVVASQDKRTWCRRTVCLEVVVMARCTLCTPDDDLKNKDDSKVTGPPAAFLVTLPLLGPTTCRVWGFQIPGTGGYNLGRTCAPELSPGQPTGKAHQSLEGIAHEREAFTTGDS